MKAFYIFIVLLLFTIQLFGQDLKYSIVRNDNDYVAYKDNFSPKDATPKRVLEKFQLIVDELKYDSPNIEFYSYKIILNETIDIYSLLVNYNLKKECYVLAYNKKVGTITNTPIIINVKWSFNNESGFSYKLLEYPLVGIRQINNNFIVCLKERVHNGNMYNAVIDKLYSLNDDMSFDLRFCYEEASLTLDNQIIKRYLKDNTISVYIKKDTSCEIIGKIEIDAKAKKIIKTECLNDKFSEVIFTTSGKEDEYILKNGFTLKY